MKVTSLNKHYLFLSLIVGAKKSFTETPWEIVACMQNFISNGEALLENYQLLKDAKGNISTETISSVLDEVVKSVVEELGIPKRIGGVARKYTKRFVKQHHIQKYDADVKRLKDSIQNWLGEIVTVL